MLSPIGSFDQCGETPSSSRISQLCPLPCPSAWLWICCQGERQLLATDCWVVFASSASMRLSFPHLYNALTPTAAEQR